MTVDFGRAARGLRSLAPMGLAACLLAAPAAAQEEAPGVFWAKDRGHAAPAQSGVATAAAPVATHIAVPRVAPHGATTVALVPNRAAAATLVRASWYGGGEKLSARTASGERFNPWGMTAAHRTLPLGTRLQVSLGGKSVVVTVTDRGPAKHTGRALDLSRGAARALGFERAGAASLQMAVLGQAS